MGHGVTSDARTGRARLYQILAETLSEPSSWLCKPGHQWPLTEAALQVTNEEGDAAIRQVVVQLASVPPEPLEGRKRRYETLLADGKKPHLWFYESLAQEGRLAGASTFAVWSIYRAAGLEVSGTELPDHVSVELAFLAYLAEQETISAADGSEWRKARRLFIKRHAGRWIPALGNDLAQTGDPVYGPIGLLLATTVRSELQPKRRAGAGAKYRLPVLTEPEACNLCSFCAQVCPTHTLVIHETNDTTALLLNDSTCVSCGRCVRVCPKRVLDLGAASPGKNVRTLYHSPRAHCPGCGRPTVSLAELKAVSDSIGTPEWLNYCPDCRLSLPAL